MNYLSALFFASLFCIPSFAGMVSENGKFTHPGGMHTASQLNAVKSNLHNEPWQSAYNQLLQEADKAVVSSFSAVENFFLPDYYGHPREHMDAKQNLSDSARSAYAMALAYQLTDGAGKNKYAEKTIKILNLWASVNEYVSGSDGNLVMCYAGLPLVFSAELIADFDGWNGADRDLFKKWLKEVFMKSADKIKNRANNQGDWGTFASITAGYFLDDRQRVLAETKRVKKRIADSIDKNGEFPRENKRANSGMWYTYFALAPMTGAAYIAGNALGENLFDYTAPNGRNIKTALDKFFWYCKNPDKWPYKKPKGLYGKIYSVLYPCADEVELPSPVWWPGNLYEAMSPVYKVKEWEEWIKPSRPISGGRAWLFPTLMQVP